MGIFLVQGTVVGVDANADILDFARQRVGAMGWRNVEFRQGDLYDLPFAPESFDHVFVCFVLEHLSRPVQALAVLDRLLAPDVRRHDHDRTRERQLHLPLLPPFPEHRQRRASVPDRVGPQRRNRRHL